MFIHSDIFVDPPYLGNFLEGRNSPQSRHTSRLKIMAPPTSINQQTRSHRDKEIDNLLNRIGQGCNQSAETLYRKYNRALYAFIRMRISNDQAAEELVNDTFMIAFRKHQHFDGSASFKTWLFGIAKNVCGTWIRKQRGLHGKTAVPIEDIEETMSACANGNYKNAQALLEEAEFDDALQLCIDKLPLRQREALHWTWYEELTVNQVAEHMACAPGTVKAQLHNARNKLINCLRSAFGLEIAHAG